MYLEQLPFEPYPFQEQAILERWDTASITSDLLPVSSCILQFQENSATLFLNTLIEKRLCARFFIFSLSFLFSA